MPGSDLNSEDDRTTVKALRTKDYKGKQKHEKSDRSQSLSPTANKKQNNNNNIMTENNNIMTNNQLPSATGIALLNFQATIPTSNNFEPLSIGIDTSAPQNEENTEKKPPMILESITHTLSYSKLFYCMYRKKILLLKL